MFRLVTHLFYKHTQKHDLQISLDYKQHVHVFSFSINSDFFLITVESQVLTRITNRKSTFCQKGRDVLELATLRYI